MLRLTLLIFLTMAGVSLGLTGCDAKPPASEGELPATTNQSQALTNLQQFQVRGVVVELKPDGKTAKIRHEEIPGYMRPMTMDFEARNTNELRGLAAGDVISFRLNATDDDGWIDQVKKAGAVPPSELPSRQSVRLSKDVDPLDVGDALPNYPFTNELGKAVSLADFKGKVLAVNFIFTTCPFPTFCPRMAANFTHAGEALKKMENGPTNWHLLTITIDPETDTPEVLLEYGKRHNYDPARWNFLTGDIIEITALCEQVGQQFWREGGTINHNLRTLVIDPDGKLQKVFTGNEWKSSELVEEMVKAAAPR